MVSRLRPLVAAMAVAFSTTAAWQVQAQTSPETQTLDSVVVNAGRIKGADAATDKMDSKDISPLRAATSDTATLLRDVPGVNISGAGGVSGLPVIHGLADDRIRIKVDGMDLISACANHMNSPLSYIDPNNVEQIRVFAGITPVSVGGDSIGGTILVNSAAPKFAKAGEKMLVGGQLGSFYRSNGNAIGGNASATVATENLSVSYNGSTAQSDNYKSAKDFKPAGQAAWGKGWLQGNEVGSSSYRAENHALGVALKHENHLLDLKLGYQHIPYQGYPNQHMDMTDNESTQVNLRYTGVFDWGKLETRLYNERTSHKMNFGDEKLYWFGASRNVAGMPMETEGKNTGVQIKADINLSARDTLRVGSEYQRYRLSDWWAPVANSAMMSPNTFWNINDGQRDRFDVFAEWEAQWTSQWQSLVGLRSSTVTMNTGSVQGYNGMYNASNFNASDRKRSDDNIDLTALARYVANASQTYEGGYARKTRSPSLYERYTWSNNGMALAMNNWVNDGNGYVGNLTLKPEVAHTLSFTADWHDAAKESWGLKVTPYFTYVKDYIDATCLSAPCRSDRFVSLTLVNQDARLFGADISGFMPVVKASSIGSVTARGVLGYVDGKNLSTGDNLYNIMPLNAKLALEHRIGNWTNTIEEQLVSGKHQVSAVRNEIKTKGYGLLNLRSSYEWKQVRLDLGLDNALNQQYAAPLGGAYIGQGSTMSLNGTGAPYGIAVPGMGRSLYAGVNVKF
ncbi:TonB-dependent receptor plug domain-containing protein [Dechloromonas sp. TW-R-39-2]|uniref:TonB-dependent receptor plug domain-containing protein n=1 Tax=Dechloromonas sp. TW-R-39-2 TaxID=2654218 RepID=UPI00193EB1B5|nr:TonB-dependent receptor [Dechloromonas sp. TW-R-39-2]QRM18114.1 TonB-dependent receptor plug domain-containing protein [Dechloromonas sp. TW-R-39-2]